jgi:CelD/BcsL family acetyltransferase involved in cellulose biosynthesis
MNVLLDPQMSVAGNTLTARTFDWRDWDTVQPAWSHLAEVSHGSVFLSPEWTGIWLQIFGELHKARIVVFENSSEAVGICILSESKTGPNVLPLRRLSLNAAGESRSETTYIEFNDLLCKPEWRTQVCNALVTYLSGLEWDELALDGFPAHKTLEALKASWPTLTCSEVTHPSYFVDLAGLRATGLPYDSVLSSSHRKHLRQNIRYYSAAGRLELEPITDVPAALAALEELGDLSELRSAALGRTGVFASPRFREFHRRMVTTGLPAGRVQMLHFSVAGETVGLIYNLVLRGKVYFYQCGFRYTAEKRLSPGIVTLAHAIEYCSALGFDEYDFLSGESRYKEWMATGSRELRWAVLRKPTFRAQTVDFLRRAKRSFRERVDQ